MNESPPCRFPSPPLTGDISDQGEPHEELHPPPPVYGRQQALQRPLTQHPQRGTEATTGSRAQAPRRICNPETPGTPRTASARRATSGSSRRRARSRPQPPPRTRASHTLGFSSGIRHGRRSKRRKEKGYEVTPENCACAGKESCAPLLTAAQQRCRESKAFRKPRWKGGVNTGCHITMCV